jgi:translation initiation factor 2 alpha subunit (eIF-2alpha)
MESVKFHCKSKPQAGEIVQVTFTSRHEDHTEGHLTEYEGDIIMVHSQATTKKKIKSFNKVIPLDKPLAAIIEEFDESKNNGSVSRAYLKDVEENYTNKFVNNGKIFNGVYQLCDQMKMDFKDIWENKFYPFISSFELEDSSTYLDVLNTKLDELDKIFDNKEFVDKLKEKFKSTSTKKEIYKKKVGIISNGGVEFTKRLISSSLEDSSVSEHKDSISISYFNTPNYMIETDISNELLEDFIKSMQENSKKMQNIFVKVY